MNDHGHVGEDKRKPREVLLGSDSRVAYQRDESSGMLRRLPAAESVKLHGEHQPPMPRSLEARWPSILDRIRNASSVEELRINMLKVLTETDANSATKRKWREAADRRAAQLKVKLS